MTEENQDKKAKWISVLKLVAIVVIVLSIPAYIYFAHPELIDRYMSVDGIQELLRAYHRESVLIYIGLSIFQVVCSLPGQIFQMAGGYAFGFWIALPLSILGVWIGCTIAYFLSQKLGHDAIRNLFGHGRVTSLLDQVNSKKGVVILFTAYLIPGMPKDLVNYVAGLSDIKYKPFIILCMIGRIPGMTISLFIGDAVTNGDYTRAFIAAGAVLAAAGLCLLRRKQIIDAFGRFYDKYFVESKSQEVE